MKIYYFLSTPRIGQAHAGERKSWHRPCFLTHQTTPNVSMIKIVTFMFSTVVAEEHPLVYFHAEVSCHFSQVHLQISYQLLHKEKEKKMF